MQTIAYERAAVRSSMLILVFVVWSSAIASAEMDWGEAARKAGYVVFRHNSLELIEPSHVPDRRHVATNLTRDLARGEYDPIQIGIHGIADDLKNIRVELIGNLISLRLKGRSTNARDMADFGRPYPLPFFDDGG